MLCGDMIERVQQLILDFPCKPALGSEDFFVSSSNKAAIELIGQWPNWPAKAVFLLGAKGSGKSHLANVWQNRSGADKFMAAEFSIETMKQLSGNRPLVIEDLDKGIFDEHALFHLINLAAERDFSILFTGTAAPGRISISLPDLRSRVRSMPLLSIDPPDEMLLKTMMIKQFQDRQLDVRPELIEYLAARMEWSFEGVQRVVETLDQAALASGRRLTRQFAGDVLREFECGSGPRR